MPARPRRDLFGGCLARDRCFVSAQFERERNARLVQVETEYTTAIRFEKLNCELSDEPESDHDDRFAKRRFSQSHSLQRDCAERSIRAGFKTDTLRQVHT